MSAASTTFGTTWIVRPLEVLTVSAFSVTLLAEVIPVDERPSDLFDDVTTERDGSNPEVLGLDGFAAAKRDGSWADTGFSPIAGPLDSERIPVKDKALATALSKEARASVKFSPARSKSAAHARR